MNLSGFDVLIVGDALNDLGFEGLSSIEGVALNSFGFVWPLNSIWTNSESSITTGWTNSETSITTGWTLVESVTLLA